MNLDFSCFDFGLKKRHKYIAYAVFLIVLAVRLHYSFQTHYFSDSYSYFNLRQVEYIREHGLPLYNDPLSYGGRLFIFLPFFHYVVAAISYLIHSFAAAKILTNVLAALTIIIVYYLVMHITKNERVSLLTSIISAFIPIFFSKTINSLNAYSAIVPLTLLLFYFFLRLPEKGCSGYFILVFFILMLTHASAILFVTALIFYLVLVKIENMALEKSEIEVSLFSIFTLCWLYLIIFKKSFLEHGFRLVWQNIPVKYISTYFHQVTIWEAIYLIGIIPFMFGLFFVYYYLFNMKNKKTYLIISYAILVAVFMWLKLIQLELAMMLLAVMLVVLFGVSYDSFESYLDKTKARKYKNIAFAAVCVVFVFTSLLPSLAFASQTVASSTPQEKIDALHYIRDNLPYNLMVASTVEEGHLVTYFAQRKNFMDSNFLLVPNINDRMRNIDLLFSTISNIKATEIFLRYDIDYLLFTDYAKELYKTQELRYADKQCFDKIVFGNNELYHNKCVVKKIESPY